MIHHYVTDFKNQKYPDIKGWDGEDTQRDHIFTIKFKLPIVNDGIEYKDDNNKSDCYSLIDGDKESTIDLMVRN